MFDLETAQQVFGAPGLVDGVNVTDRAGCHEREVQTRLVQALGPGFEVDLASEFAADRSSQFSDFFALLTQRCSGSPRSASSSARSSSSTPSRSSSRSAPVSSGCCAPWAPADGR